jgi:hypothetical protein
MRSAFLSPYERSRGARCRRSRHKNRSFGFGAVLTRGSDFGAHHGIRQRRQHTTPVPVVGNTMKTVWSLGELGHKIGVEFPYEVYDLGQHRRPSGIPWKERWFGIGRGQ